MSPAYELPRRSREQIAHDHPDMPIPHDYSDACPCSSCSRVRRRRVEPRTGQPTDQGSR